VSSKILIEAMQRGVKVRIITPGEIIDTQTVRAASRKTWGPLLKAGVEIYEFQPTMYHCKVMIIDGLLVSVGSTNFDNRSLSLNDEANLNIYDEKFATRQTSIFEEDLKKARPVSFEQWSDRPIKEKAMEIVGSMLSSQL
jgi:cardiolipin synthase